MRSITLCRLQHDGILRNLRRYVARGPAPDKDPLEGERKNIWIFPQQKLFVCRSQPQNEVEPGSFDH